MEVPCYSPSPPHTHTATALQEPSGGGMESLARGKTLLMSVLVGLYESHGTQPCSPSPFPPLSHATSPGLCSRAAGERSKQICLQHHCFAFTKRHKQINFGAG